MKLTTALLIYSATIILATIICIIYTLKDTCTVYTGVVAFYRPDGTIGEEKRIRICSDSMEDFTSLIDILTRK